MTVILTIQVWEIRCCGAIHGKMKRRARLEENRAFVSEVLSLRFKLGGCEVIKAVVKENVT